MLNDRVYYVIYLDRTLFMVGIYFCLLIKSMVVSNYIPLIIKEQRTKLIRNRSISKHTDN